MDIQERLLGLIPLLVSLAVHEWAHAYTAFKLGDDTAAKQGRLTLNPIAHIDLMGTVILPLYLILSNAGFFFGWAKPVPVDPTRFRRGVSMFKGMLITSLAGPASNFIMAFLFALAIRVTERFFEGSDAVVMAFTYALLINVVLGVFNLMPVPPLDGHRLLPMRIQESLRPYSMFIFIGFLVLFWNCGTQVRFVVFTVSGWVMEVAFLIIPGPSI